MMMEEAMMEMTAEDFNKVIEANTDCDIVITMVSLPFAEDELYAMGIFEMMEDENNPGEYKRNPDRLLHGSHPAKGFALPPLDPTGMKPICIL